MMTGGKFRGRFDARRNLRLQRNRRGMALLLVLALMSAAAVMFYLEAPRLAMQSQRGKEQLLIDRGEQYQRAIQLYYRKLKTWPQTIEDLEKGNNNRFLRRRYVDPFTGKADWRLVHMQNGVYSDSLVYNQKDQNKEQRQVFVANLGSVGNAGDYYNNQGDDAVNPAMRVGASDRMIPPGGGVERPDADAGPKQPGELTARKETVVTDDPLLQLPPELRDFVNPNYFAGKGMRRPAYNPDEDQQYTNGATAPTNGVFGVGNVTAGDISSAQLRAGRLSTEEQAAIDKATPQPGAGGFTFQELQQKAREAERNGGTSPFATTTPQQANQGGGGLIGGGGGFIGGSVTPQAPVPGAMGLSYQSIAGGNAYIPPSGGYDPGAPPVPGTNGLPSVTGINPPAPSFGTAPRASTSPGFGGGGFIGGSGTTTASNSAAFPGGVNPDNFGRNLPQGYSQSANGLSGYSQGAVAAPNGAAQQMLNIAIFGPRQGPGAAGGTAAGGSGLAGVASKYRGATVKVYREQARYQLWEFIYDPAKDTSMKPQQGGQLPGSQPAGGLPQGGLPPGATNPGNQSIPGFGPTGAPANQGGARPSAPAPSAPASGRGGFVGGGGFIGGGAPVPVPTAPTTPGQNTPNQNTPNPNAPRPPGTPAPPPTQPAPGGGGGFIR